MPELPEVRVVCKALRQKVLHKRIKDLVILKEKLFKEKNVADFKKALLNKEILNIENRGKHIIIFLSDNIVLLSHLRMEGKYRYYDKPSPEDSHLMARFIFEDNSELHYCDSRMFGTFYLRDLDNYNKILPLSKVANEPNSVNIDEVYKKLKHSDVSIKTKLLDQEIVSGIGNIYIDEALFASKISPLTKSSSLSKEQIAKIIKNAGDIMEISFQKGGTTLFSYESLNNQEGEYQNFLKVHNDKLKECSVCHNPTKKIKVNQRGTYYCPHCQKEY
ncbi:DNA-formamidopyrimidine glycosylase [Metamycoplasma neophronis]|uniref:DNA-formamidopyrimidine glycosylase n=1 Tax=Metamycoplasma neophronis TaxID=872983 RepID=A0ABY2Z4E2_9BACT|nr:DNA-formamidopyrimidine glycosylase [Metamycoplasma neophronis]TPR54276.1 DNA-formamidopyrimidine glycosylase [Metamycoplasma neophronis]